MGVPAPVNDPGAGPRRPGQACRFPGSEIELMELGVIRAGVFDGLKARLLLTRARPRRSRPTAFPPPLRGSPCDRPGDGGPMRPP